MTTLLNVTVTTAVAAAVTPSVFFRDAAPQSLLVQGAFTYGSAGTTADAWVQTSVDGGVTWIDIANFHFTISTARFLYNLSSLTPITTEYTATDGTLAANTSKDGIVSGLMRCKYTTTGTYAGGTILRVDVFPQPYSIAQ